MNPDFDKANSILFSCIREASLEVMKSETKSEEFVIDEKEQPSPEQLQYFEEISCILLTSEELKIIFKAHYWLNTMKKMIKIIQPNLPAILMTKKSRDFAKELCNIIAGRIKFQFVPLKCNIGQSLPINLDGYNQIFFITDRKDTFTTSWYVMDQNLKICFSSTIEYFNPEIVNKIGESLSPTLVQAPSVEIL